jgi:3-oxoacyl-[acyl-carrier protein] reductase
MKKIMFPNWLPHLNEGAKVLIVGASGGIGAALVQLILQGSPCVLGAHRSTAKPLSPKLKKERVVIDLQSTLQNESDCRQLVDSFVDQAGGISGLVVLVGGISQNGHWKNISEKAWKDDIDLNLNIPFFLARTALERMKKKGGQIVLMGTESALHGGSPTSFPYGVAKRGVECLVEGLAREGAKHDIQVNGVRAGFIRSGFHERWQGKTPEDIKKRIEMIPLKRAGEPEEAAALIMYLLSGWARFVTGQMISISGGDWL